MKKEQEQKQEVVIQNYFGYRYNAAALDEVEERVSDAEEVVNDMNDDYMDTHGGHNANHYKVCQLCGRIIVNEKHGLGLKCYESIQAMLPTIMNINKELKENMDTFNLQVWSSYSKAIRSAYVAKNSKADGTLKNFRSDFKKSFVPSIAKAERISRKQVDVMIREFISEYEFGGDVPFSDIHNKWLTIKEHNEEEFEKLLLDYKFLLLNHGAIDFARITYKRAWIDNPLDKEVEFD